MAGDCMTFSNTNEYKIRVAFDPDGTPWYCCIDVAALVGYRLTDKVIEYASKIEHSIEVEFRNVTWFNTKGPTKRNFSTRLRVFKEKDARAFLGRIATNDAVKWFLEEVIPAAKERGEEIARKTAEEQKAAPPQRSQSIIDRLDAVIMECLLMKQELARK